MNFTGSLKSQTNNQTNKQTAGSEGTTDAVVMNSWLHSSRLQPKLRGSVHGPDVGGPALHHRPGHEVLPSSSAPQSRRLPLSLRLHFHGGSGRARWVTRRGVFSQFGATSRPGAQSGSRQRGGRWSPRVPHRPQSLQRWGGRSRITSLKELGPLFLFSKKRKVEIGELVD